MSRANSVILRKVYCIGRITAQVKVHPLSLTSCVTLNETLKFMSISFLIS